MKHTFVLDECVILFAQNFTNEHGNEDFTSAALMYSIAVNCHKIAVNEYLANKYYEKIKAAKQTFGSPIIRLINHLLRNTDKNIFLTYIPDFPFESEIPIDDLPIVKTAVHTRSLFVTANGKLRRKIEELEIPRKHSIKVLDPKDALPYAQAADQ